MSRLRVLCTKPDGSVAIICPSARCLEILRDGGGINLIAHAPKTLGTWRTGLRDWLKENADAETIRMTERTGYLPLDLARSWEIAKFVRSPDWHPDRADREELAARWIDARIHGGLSEREAVWLIGEFSAGTGYTALEIVDLEEVPKDRTHRDAWRRSTNGGPIWVDEDRAQAIDEARMWSAHERDQHERAA